MRAAASAPGDAVAVRKVIMDCTIQGCPGKYEGQYIVHTSRHNERIIVIDNVPAEVCDTCGDTLLSSIATRRIDEMLSDGSRPTGVVPLYDFMDQLSE